MTFKSAFADRGKKAEDAVHKALERWVYGRADRDFTRLMDTRAAGRVVKSAAADFEFFTIGAHGLVECKSTEHTHRLARDKVPQLPRMRKRELAGGVCIVLVHHSTLGVWRTVQVKELVTFGDKGSWDLTDWPSYPSAQEALGNSHEVFSHLLDLQERLVYCHYCRTHKPSTGFKVLSHINGTKRYRCPECHEVRANPEAKAERVRKDTEVRQGEQATRVLLAKEAKTRKRKTP
jgi:hypothetical protein